MNAGIYKFRMIMCGMLLTGAVYANDLQPKENTAPAKEMAAPSDQEFAGFAEAQFLYGVYCKEKRKDDKTAYKYLELAAKQNHRNAWLYLGKCYSARKDEHASYLLWAKLCYMAAERIAPDAVVEFHIGLLEGVTGNLEEYKKWMKLSSEKGFAEAAEMLANKDYHAEILAIKKQRANQKNPDALKQAFHSHHERIRQFTGTTGPEVMDQLAGRPAVSSISDMIRMPHPEGVSIPGWQYDSAATEALIAENLMADREGGMRWITEEFREQPIWENLGYPNPTIRAINATHEEELTKSLDRSFKRCSKEEIKRMIAPFMYSDAPEGFYDNDVVWNLGNDLYFRIHTSTDGSWRLRDYHFFIHKNSKSVSVEIFPNPPDTADAAMVAGMILNLSDCWNNLAVKYADGEMDQVFRCDDEAEEILKELVKRRHAVGTYNLAVFYQNRGKGEEAEKHFKLAEEFAGSSVISYSAQPPEIFDRNGELLVKNKLFRTKKDNARIYTRGGRFAASLIGHIVVVGKKAGRDALEGRSGMEQIISRKHIDHPVYLTLDPALQTGLETLISSIAQQSDPRYAYGIIVNSRGELVAAAQSSIFELEKRSFKEQNPSEDWNGWLFMPAGYVFPVADQWMKLLGSSSYADPFSKEKLQLHQKQGVFYDEAQGIVLGLNRMRGNRNPKQVSGQMATMMNYVYAYIGTTEKKAIPKPIVYTDKVNTPIKPTGGIQWISFYRPPDGIVVNALGVIKTEDPQENLYVCIRAVHEERNYVEPPTAEAKKNAAAKADKAEQIIKAYSFEPEKEYTQWEKNISDALKQIVDQYAPTAAEIALYDIRSGKIVITERAGNELPAFAPMSHLKPFVVAAALEAGTATMNDVIDCGNGKIDLAGATLQDFQPLGEVTVAEVLQKSSNIGTWMIAKKLGFDPLQKFLSQAGFKKSSDAVSNDLIFSQYALGAKHLVSTQELLSAWAYLLKYPQVTASMNNPSCATALHLQEKTQKYTCSAIGYYPRKNPRYILLIAAYDFSKSKRPVNAAEMSRQWQALEGTLH